MSPSDWCSFSLTWCWATVSVLGRRIHLRGGLLKSILPGHVVAKGGYFAYYFADGQNALNDWIIFMVIGTFIGGLVSSLLGGRYKAEIVKETIPHGRDAFLLPWQAAS